MRRYLVEVRGRRGLRVTRTDVLVIGSGVAGLSAAVEASGAGQVLVLSKGRASEGSTGDAQGGIAVVMAPWDSAESHVEDTILAGAGLCDREAVGVLVREGSAAVGELIGWGARFDRDGGTYHFTQEGAHSRRRIVHASGDATGAEVERVLLARAGSLEQVGLGEGVFVLDLLTEDGRCTGAVCWDSGAGEPVLYRARATILAAGGLGRLYEDTTNPPVSTGDGFAIAYRAGCELQDLEFVQFHPTALAADGATAFLISEAVRGEGGVLRNARGERFMPGWHAMGDLAPRDVACRAIVEEMRRTRVPHVLLDVTHLRPDFVRGRFPTIDERCREHGLDITVQPIPVRPAAHFSMGGVRTDLEGATNVPGLLACGEAASVGVHGANRLASNSLLEGLVFGRRAGASAARACGAGAAPGEGPAVGDAERPLEGGPVDTAAVRAELRHWMERRVGIDRCEPRMGEFVEKMGEWEPLADREFAGTEAFETQNMLALARLVTGAAMTRRESRGAHYREDYPRRDDDHWGRHILQKKD